MTELEALKKALDEWIAADPTDRQIRPLDVQELRECLDRAAELRKQNG